MNPVPIDKASQKLFTKLTRLACKLFLSAPQARRKQWYIDFENPCSINEINWQECDVIYYNIDEMIKASLKKGAEDSYRSE